MKSKITRIFSVLLALVVVIGLIPSLHVTADSQLNKHYNFDGFDVDYHIVNVWNDGYNAQITVTNTSEYTFENWAFLFDYNQEVSGIWNATISDNKGKYYIASNNIYNHDILPGQNITFGFTAAGEIYYPQYFAYISSASEVEQSRYELSYNVNYQNAGEYNLDVSITNQSEETIEDWKLRFDYPCQITNIWNADVILSADEEHIINNSANAYIYPNQTVTFGVSLTTDKDISKIFEEYSLVQICRLTCDEIGIPSQVDITDEAGNFYYIEWDSDDDTEPHVYPYTEIPLDQILDLQKRYSVSSIGTIYFDMPPLNGYAEVTTEFLEEPDLILRLDLEKNVLKLIPFSNDGTVCSFNINQSSIIIPVKYVESSQTYDAKNTPMLMSAISDNSGDDSDIKMFNIISNADGKIEVELTALLDTYYGKSRDIFFRDELYVKIIDTDDVEHKIYLDRNKNFSFTSEKSGKLNITVYDKNIFFDDLIWEQDVYVQRDLSISEEKQNELLQKYAPIVVYDSDENYAPMSIEDIFDRIENRTCLEYLKFKTVYGTHKVNVENLPTYMAYNGNNDYLLDWHSHLINMWEDSFSTIWGSFANATLYTYIQEDENNYYLTYYFIYGFDRKVNGDVWYSFEGRFNYAGAHNLDRESMTVVLDKNFNPQSVITGGHLPSTNITYLDGNNKIFSWTKERVKTDYEQMISDFSQGHPIVYIERGQHCVMPVSGKYNTGFIGNAGLVQDIYKSDGTFYTDKIKAIFPTSYSTDANINVYSMKDLGIDRMYADNILNFSGYWVDVFGPGSLFNAKFPPFLSRDYAKTEYYDEATKFDKTGISLSDITKRTREQFENAYLFSLSGVENFRYTITGDVIKLNWDEIIGADGYEIIRIGQDKIPSVNLTPEYFHFVVETGNSYIDTGISSNKRYTYYIRAYYDSDKSSYGSNGVRRIYTQNTLLSDIEPNRGSSTIIINVKDADTNLALSDVDIYLDDTYVGTTDGVPFTLKVLSGIEHTIMTRKAGYNDVLYKSIILENSETLSLETIMQVPFTAGAPYGNADITVRNALNGAAIPDLKFIIRNGMNAATGSIYMITASDANGKIHLENLPSGNYTGVIQNDDYIKTVFNFVIIGGKVKTYEVHVSPVLSDSEIRIVLSWGANPQDLDSHFRGNGLHVHYGNKSATGVSLDHDDRNGYGPETITINTAQLPQGVYSYYVYRFAGSGTIASSGATVKVYQGNLLLKTYYADQSDSTTTWNVFWIDTFSNQIIDY